MKNHLYQLIFCCFWMFSLASTSWSQSEFYKQQQTTYPAANKCITQLPDSGYFVAMSYNSGNEEQLFKRLDKYGNVIWSKKATLAGTQSPLRVLHTSKKKLVSASYTPGSTFGVLFMDYNGTSLSHRQFSFNTSFYESFRADLAESPDQKIYALGTNHLVKMDSVGNVIWQKRYSVSGMNLMNVHPISSSTLILTGFAPDVQAINSDYDLVEICIDSSGAILWSKSFGSRTQEKPLSSVYANGKIYFTGAIDNYLSGRRGSFLFCTDTAGTQLWCKWTDDFQGYHEMVKLTDGTLAVLTNANNGSYVKRYSENGDFLSGFKSTYAMKAIAATSDGGVYMETNGTMSNLAYGVKVAANMYPSCFPILPYSPDTTFNQVLDEMPLLCSAFTYTTSSAMNPTWSNMAFANVTVCNSTCNVIAAFKPDNTHICQGETVTFANTSQSATMYEWWMNNTMVATTATFSQVFATPGVYNVKLIASNGTCVDSTFSRILVSAPLPTPTFTYETDHFKGWFNTQVPPYGTATWDFGDGTGSQKHIDSLIHNYNLGGTYQVCLTETNVCGTVAHCEDVTFSVDSTYEFIKHYNEDSFYNGRRWGRAAKALASGAFLLSGIDDTWGSTGWEGTLIKTDKKGNPIWTQIVSIPADDNFEITRMAESRKGYFLFGASNGASPFIGIMDSSGTSSYFMRLSTTSSGAVMGTPYERPDGNIIFTGCYGTQTFITQVDLALGVHWFKRHTGVRTMYGSLKVSDGFMIVGTDLSNTQIGIMKLNDNGDYVYNRSISHTGSTPTSARDIFPTSDGNFIITGSTNGDLYLMKIDPLSNVLWTKRYRRTGDYSIGIGMTVTEDPSGNLTVISYDGYVIKTDASGNVIWGWKPVSTSDKAVRHSNTLDGGLIIAATVKNYFDPTEEEMSMYRFSNNGNAPTCWGQSVTLLVTPLTAVVSNSTDVMTVGAPTFTEIYSNNVYASLQAEICASGSPILDANFSNGNACTSTPVQFSNSSLGTISSYSWSFSGGSPATSTAINPQVTWSTPGTYTVTLTVTNAGGVTDTETHTVVVANGATVNAGNDVSTCAGTPVQLTGTGNGTLSWSASPSLSNPSMATTSANPPATETFILHSVLGACAKTDTVVVTVHPEYASTNVAGICSGDTYSFHGQTFSTSGLHTVPFTTVYGCDSTFSVQLTVYAPQSTTLNASICSGESYSVGGSTFSTAGTYTVALQNQYGCDSTVTLNLSVFSATSSTVNATICSGESYTIGTNTFTTAGTHTAVIENTNGCDSTVTLNLTVLPNSSSTVNAQICLGDSYTIGGYTFTTAGTHTAVLTSVNGCDSVVTVNLTVNSGGTSSTTISVCAGESYLFNGTTYTTTGTYTANLATGAGCDSIATLYLTVLDQITTTLNETICSGQSYAFNGNTYTTSGVYSGNFTSANGCDSTVTLNLTVLPNSTTTVDAEVCSGESYSVGGIPFNATGTHTVTMQSANGCDSIVTLNLNVLPAISSTLNGQICPGEGWWFSGTYYTTPGTYVEVFSAANGCDSVVTFNLTLISPDVSVTVSGFTLTANASNATYSWINCDNEMLMANTQSFTATQNGNYAVVVTQNNCSDTSDCYAITQVGLEEPESEGWSVYPVPSDDLVYIVSTSGIAAPYVLYDNAGRMVVQGMLTEETTTISLLTLSTGVYQLKIADLEYCFKVIRR